MAEPALWREKDPSKGLNAPKYPHWRLGAVRLVLPGVDDPEQRLRGDQAQSIAAVIDDLLTEDSRVKEVEILSYPGRGQYEYLLTPKLHAEHSATDEATIPIHDRQLSNVPRSTQLEAVSERLAERLAEVLPPEFGIERCNADLATFGVTPAPTARLLLEKNRETVESNFVRYNPMVESIRQLLSTDTPHATQTLVRPASENGRFYVASRLVKFDAAAMPQSSWEFADLVENDEAPWDVGDVWEAGGLVTNADLPIRDFWATRGSYPAPQEVKYCELSDSFQARDLWLGRTEWQEFLSGRSGYDQLYERTLGYGRIPVSSSQLRLFAPVYPDYPDADLWAAAGPREPAYIETIEVVREAPGTDQALGSTDAAPPERSGAVQNVGGTDHRQLLPFAINYFCEQGYDAWEVEQDGSSIPDGGLETPAMQAVLEVESKNLSKPGNVLTNKARAIHQDTPVIFVVRDADDAQKVYNYLREPYAEAVDDGVKLYTISTTVCLDDGTVPVLPDGVDSATWILTREGDLELRAGDRVLASGPAKDSVCDFEYATRRLEQTDDGYRLLSETGEEIATGVSASAVLDGATRVSVPHVPMRRHYLDDSEIRYQAGNELPVYEARPDWARSADGLRDQYTGAMNEWLRIYLDVEGDAELPLEAFRERFRTYYQRRLHTGLFGEPPDPPDDGEIGRALPDDIGDKRRKVEGEWTRFLRDLVWSYPAGIVSPDHPFIGGADDNGAGTGGTDNR